MSNPMQALPTYGQWAEFKRRMTQGNGDAVNVCIYCRAMLTFFGSELIRIGCRIKLWEEEVIPHDDGTEEVKLKSRVVAVSLKGIGCSVCQELMLKAEADEMRRYEKANEEWMELHTPKVVSPTSYVDWENKRYLFSGGAWYNSKGMKLPGKDQPAIAAAYREKCNSAINEAVRPWMMAALEHAKVPAARRTPTKRIPYLDVTEAVLKMSKGTKYDSGKPTESELLPDDTPAWKL